MQIFENSDEKQYDKISIRKFVLNNFKKIVVSKSMMKKKISSSKKFQLFTFDDTSSFKSASISNFVAIEISRFFFRKETSNKKMMGSDRGTPLWLAGHLPPDTGTLLSGYRDTWL
jgi:hypothetical protein